MSIIKNITTYPNTGRGFAAPGNTLYNISGVFLAKKDFTITTAELSSNTVMYDAFEDGDIIPLHIAQSIVNSNEETIIQNSLQDYDYKIREGKYKHTLRFDWAEAYHSIVDSYSGTDLYVIYYDANNNLILAEESSGVYRGIKTDSLILQKQLLFTSGSEIAYSDLNIELASNETIKVIAIDWMPELIDKLFIQVTVVLAGSDFINFTVKNKGANIDTVQAEDVTIIDDQNGEITGIVVSYLLGIYQASNFSSSITTGCLTVSTPIYLGRNKYTATISVIVESNMTDEYSNNILDEYDNNLISEI